MDAATFDATSLDFKLMKSFENLPVMISLLACNSDQWRVRFFEELLNVAFTNFS